MHVYQNPDFAAVCERIGENLLRAPEVGVGTWQGLDVRDHPLMVTQELQDVSLAVEVPGDLVWWQKKTGADLPWAEDHFQERVSGEPLNPPPSASYWPWTKRDHEEFKDGGVFDHTYPERFWPKFANTGGYTDEGRQIFVPHVGVRFKYGDLADLIDVLGHDPHTRQAYLPVWFPEDLDAAHKSKRVPCTLGYHFLLRNGWMTCTYYIRSVDFVKHFRNDVYMAGRLLQWVVATLREEYGVQARPKRLVMHIASLHVFRGDLKHLTGDAG